MEGLAQSNLVLKSENNALMAQLSQMTATMNVMQAQLNTLYAVTTTTPKRKYQCWSYGSNFSQLIKACPSKKVGRKYEAYYKEIIGVS